MKKLLILLLAFALVFSCGAFAAGQDSGKAISGTEEEPIMTLIIGETEVPVTWEGNPSVEALRELAKEGLTVQMSMYGGFEQVGDLGQEIVRNDVQIRTEPGDIVLYSGDQLVIFYGNNSWAYTRLGHIDLTPEEMAGLLGHGDVTVTITAVPEE